MALETAKRHKLKKGDISLLEMLQTSVYMYKKQEADDKRKRAKLDILNARVNVIKNFVYDSTTQTWKQDPQGIRHIKFVFIVKSDPISYKKTDKIYPHIYPVTFLIRDINMGLQSSFRWRTGSFKKPLFAKPGQDYKKIQEQNIKNQVQLQFFFELMQISDMFGLLYGPNTTNRKLPKIANPTMIPYFDKHAYFCLTKILISILYGKGKTILLSNLATNSNRKI